MNPKHTGAAAVVLAGVAGLAVGFWSGRPDGASHQPAVEPQQNVSQASPAQPRYRLVGHEGKLAVFIVGKSEPEIVLNVYLHHLPDVDRLQLEEGIEVDDYQQLLRLIEDYSG